VDSQSSADVRRVLILFAHPTYQRSRANRVLLDAARGVQGVTIHDLYETYPDLDVDPQQEQKLLTNHDAVVMQFPFYWYSTPAILKQWQDLVLEHGWAYGHDGTALHGKDFLCAVTAGGSEASYRIDGRNGRTVEELLAPLRQTARLCGMRWHTPFVLYETHTLDTDKARRTGYAYRHFLEGLVDAVAGDGAG
jgi:glutathione-regulated potassium-efflux system ancillary protein KefG